MSVWCFSFPISRCGKSVELPEGLSMAVQNPAEASSGVP